MALEQEPVPEKVVLVLDVGHDGSLVVCRPDGVHLKWGSPAEVLNFVIRRRRECSGPVDLRINSDPSRPWNDQQESKPHIIESREGQPCQQEAPV